VNKNDIDFNKKVADELNISDTTENKILMNEFVSPFILYGDRKDECILLIHGFTGSPADVMPLAKALNNDGKGFTIYSILLPGHGTKMEDMSPVKWKEWVLYSSEKLKILIKNYKKVSLIGFSMGGDISLCLAAKYNIDRIVSICTPILIKNKLYFIAEFLSIFRKYNYWKKTTLIPGELDLPYSTGYKGMPVRSIAELRNITIAAFNRLHRIKQPIMVVQSLKDRTVHIKSPFLIFDNVKSQYKELLLLENSRHNPIKGIEREKLYLAVEKFLRQGIRQGDRDLSVANVTE